jgi:hypothetical protein
MSAWTIVSNILSKLDGLQLSNEWRRQHKDKEKCGNRSVDNPKTQVPEHVQKRKFGMQGIEQQIQHT